MKLDDALRVLGGHGRFQVLVFLAISMFDNLLSIWHMSAMAFLGFEQKHHCKVPEGASLNQTIPLTRQNGEWGLDKCSMYEYNNETETYSNHTVKCQNGWHYSRDPVHSSIVSEWDLVCDKNVWPEMSLMVFNFGVMFGGLIFGFLSDRYGRKKSFIGACILQAIFGTIAGFSVNFYMFTILRFIVGVLEQGVNITGFIMATELFPPKERTIYGVTHEFIWAIGGAFLPIMAYFLRDWEHLQIAISVPGVLAVGLIWLVPESLVWLISQGKIKEAESILDQAAKCNNKTLPPNVLGGEAEETVALDNGTAHEDEAHHSRVYTVIDLFRTPHLLKITVCLCTLWALNTMVYYGFSLNTANLHGDMYLNFFIAQMVEIPSVAATMFLIYKVGRRWPLCIFHILGGLVCIASPFIPEKTESGTDLTWLSITLAMLGKFAINSSFTIIYVYGPEIYPTVLRNTGSGLASTSGRIGGILYPYINYLSKLDTPYSKQLPLIVFGGFSIVGGLLALPLPETRHQPLPESIDDVEHYKEFCQRMANKNGTITSDGNAHEAML